MSARKSAYFGKEREGLNLILGDDSGKILTCVIKNAIKSWVSNLI